MIRRDRDKASVIMWSLSNETANNPTRTEFLTNLANEARKLDSTRLITSALNSEHIVGETANLDDSFANVLDVVGVNEYIGWYGGKAADADSIVWTLPNRPIIVSEFGAGAKYGNHGPITQRWTVEQQADVYKHQLVMLRKIPQLRGITPWVLFDFRSTTRNIPNFRMATTARASTPNLAKRNKPSSFCKRHMRITASAKPNDEAMYVADQLLSTLSLAA